MKHVLFKKNSLFSTRFVGGLLLSLAFNSSSVCAQNEPRYNRIASLESSNEMKSYQKDLGSGASSVSYTHLTLPTILLV